MTTEQRAAAAKKAAYTLAAVPAEIRNRALEAIAESLDENRRRILEANRQDMTQAEKQDLDPPLIQRLALSGKKIDQLIRGIGDLVKAPDPLGKKLEETELDTGLVLVKETVPIGLIGVIFESRPDALVQIGTLCIKSGNALILKGGREAVNSNRILFALLRDAVEQTDSRFSGCLQLVETREEIQELLKLDDVIDLLIPRGSGDLVRTIRESTRIPVLGHSEGVCHIYVDEEADPAMAVEIIVDAKCQYPAVCNAVETLLIHRNCAEELLGRLGPRLRGVELRGDAEVGKLIEARSASEEDWSAEYNDLILALRIVGGLEEAVDHINRHGSHHTDAIITDNRKTAEDFLSMVDSGSVLWNCSTRFADGYRYGLGAEVGISTNKIHARGPVGMEGLTIYKYKLYGRGQIVADYVEGRKHFTHRKLADR